MKNSHAAQSTETTKQAGRPTTDGQPATGHIHLRVTMRRKSAYVGAAIPKTLAAWMTEHLDKAAHYRPEEGETRDTHHWESDEREENQLHLHPPARAASPSIAG